MNRPLTVLALTAVALAGCGGGAVAKPPDGLEVADLTIDSKAVDQRTKVKVIVPAGDAERPLLVFLHGRGGNESSSLRKPMFQALKALGTRAPIVAFPSGGDHSYWHNRDSGAWGRYVMKEVIPRVIRRFGADRRRVAIGGISMGGFGAFDLARAHPKRFCAVGGHSPAVWRSGGETAPGAFDDAADFARHDVIAGAGRFADQTVWLDAGDADPFRPGDDAFTAAVRATGADVTAKTWPGGHDNKYWDRHWRDYLRFYARALQRC